MKREFELEAQLYVDKGHSITIMGTKPVDESVYVGFHKPDGYTIGWMKEKDLELFAVNILKAINSKRVLQGKVPYYKLKKYKSIKPQSK
jgi:hypothetical protein